MSDFKQYRRKEVAELRPYVEGEQLPETVSISKADKDAGSPKVGDMIARNPKNHNDQWLVAKKYFEDNFAVAKYAPIHDRVLIKPDAAEEKTEGGIIIPETAKERPNKGTVIAIGPGKKGEPTQAKPGDRVLYSKFSGTEIELEDGKYLIMSEAEILLTL